MSTYVVLDLEMCKVSRAVRSEAFDSSRELIQIGAVILDSEYAVTDTFMTYVRPEYGIIDDEIEKLTGITPRDVANAPYASEALKAFLEWLPKDAVFVAWSSSDVNQIDDELYFKNIELTEYYDLLDNFVDCQELFGRKMNAEKQYRLSEALAIANLVYDIGIHDALVDAKNTALLFAKLQNEDTLTLSPYFMTQEQASNIRSSAFGEWGNKGEN